MVNRTFPDRLDCFGQPGFEGNASCTSTNPAIINFLNLTDFSVYKPAYCLNPPVDSCAFGYCSNPDIASPGFRVAAYVSSICLSVVILYSNEDDVVEALYAQLLSTYSYIIAAVIAIAKHKLTRLHAVFALQMAGSPLSFYLVITIVKSIMSKRKDSENPSAWRRRTKNRVLVLTLVPLWVSLLIFLSLPQRIWEFQQAACEYLLQGHVVAAVLFIPGKLFFTNGETVILHSSILSALVLTWAVSIYRQRTAARKMIVEEGRGRFMASWCSVINAYPCVRLITVVIYPTLYWIITLEDVAFFVREEFQPTYGQLLAIFVVIPPVLSALPLVPRLGPWFMNLTWVRFLSRSRHKSRSARSLLDPGGYHALDNPGAFVHNVKPQSLEVVHSPTDRMELRVLVPEGIRDEK